LEALDDSFFKRGQEDVTSDFFPALFNFGSSSLEVVLDVK
jgi:hypothetical protein